ncbi:MAG: sensor histidine kinase [Saprospiraceae bacterium]
MKNTIRYILLVLVCYLGMVKGNAQGSAALYEKYLASKQLENPIQRDSQLVRDYAAYAIYRINERDPASALLLDSLALLANQSPWPKAYGIFLRVKARYFDIQGDMDNGLNYYNQAIDTLRQAGPDFQDLATALMGSGFILLNTQLYKEAFSTIQEGYHFAKLSGQLKSQLLALDFFGDYYYYSAFRQEKFDSALVYYLRAESFIDQYQFDSYFKSDNDHGLANVYRRLGKVELSDSYFQKSLEEAEKSGNYSVIYALYMDKAETFDEKKQYEEALELKLAAYEYVQASGWIEFISRADLQLYYSYKTLGDYKNALAFYEKYIVAQDSMKKGEASRRYAELEAKFKNKEKEDEIIRLQNKNLKQTRDFYFGVTLFGGVLLGFISLLNWRLRKKNKELAQKNKEVLLAQLKGQNLERKRMAVELHDNLNTKIAAIRWQLEAVGPSVDGKAQRILDKTLNLVNDVYEDVRLISHNLMPEKVEAIGLIAALKSLLGQLKQNNKINFRLVVNTRPEFDFGSLSYHIYNIIMEMINNILKHANAENGWISISETGDQIQLTVSDDGCGFDIGQMTNGYGIRNITSRLENIQGKWNIESSPGKGTKFFIEIPKLD